MHRRAERDRIESLLVHRHVDDLALVGAEDTERADVAGGLAQHHVTRVAEDPGDQIEGLLGADRDSDVVGVGRDAFEPHHLTDRFADLRLTLAGAVLHGLQPAVEHQVVQGGADHVQGQVGDVRHTAGQRHYFGPVGHREQGTNGRGRHRLGAHGVAVDVAVQSGVATGKCRGQGGPRLGAGGTDGPAARPPARPGCAVHPPRVPHRRSGSTPCRAPIGG